MQVFHRLLLIALVAALLAGCGVRYAYSQLDWLVPRYVRDYVTLDPTQRGELDSRLAERLQWHCAKELPAYSIFLRDLDRSLANGEAGSERLMMFAERAESLWRNLLVTIAPDAAELLVMLDDKQIDELAQTFDERNRKAAEEFLEPDEAKQLSQRVERMERRLRRWLGRMNAAQSEALMQWSESLLPTTEAWLDSRRAWQSRLIGLLRDPRESEMLHARVTELLTAPDAGWSDDYRAAVESNRDKTLALFARLYELADESQRDRLSRRLASFAGQFDRLACAPGDVPSG